MITRNLAHLLARACLTLLVPLAMAVGTAGQVVLSGNLSAPQGETWVEVSAYTWQAQKFTTGGGPYVLQSVELMLALSSPEDTPADILVMLYTGDNNPTTYQATLLDSMDPIGEQFSVHEFLPEDEVVLSELSSYWVVVASESSWSSFGWGWTESDGGEGAGYSPMWRTSPDNGYLWYGDVVNPFIMQVNVIPEPALVGVVAGLVVASGAWIRRRRGTAS